jgi:hypothetical protein
MRRQMRQVSVEGRDDGIIVLSQEINDMNGEPDPQIEISPEQAPLLAAWILEASGEEPDSGDREPEPVPAMFYADGPADPEELSAFHNGQGMVVLRIGEKHFLEISPSMAKRLREQLSAAIRSALTEMLRPDSEA